jgi:hypothetical protein
LEQFATSLFQFDQSLDVGRDAAIAAIGKDGWKVIQNELAIQHGNCRRLNGPPAKTRGEMENVLRNDQPAGTR